MANLDERDWATRTRVVSKDTAVSVGENGTRIQPATILVLEPRVATPEDPLYTDTTDQPMGRPSASQLARTTVWAIQHNIVEKPLRGHVAHDRPLTPPRATTHRRKERQWIGSL